MLLVKTRTADNRPCSLKMKIQRTYFVELVGHLVFTVRYRAMWMSALVTTGAAGARDVIRFTHDGAFPSDRIGFLRNAISPKIYAPVHILSRDSSAFEVSLQRDRTCKCNLIRIF